MGFYYSQSGNPIKAKFCIEQALEIATKIGEVNSTDHALILKHLASIEGQQEQFPDAAGHLKTALEIDNLNDHAQGREYGINLSNLGYYYIKSGDPAKAKPYLEQALPLIIQEFGRNSQEYLGILTMIINAKIAMNDRQELPELVVSYETVREFLGNRVD